MDIREVETKMVGVEELKKSMDAFVEQYKSGGTELRCEYVTNLCGCRIVAVFNWDDMG